jgi:two-component system cell cycle response regulator
VRTGIWQPIYNCRQRFSRRTETVPKDLSNWNILIVDDELDNIGVIEYVLNFHGAVYKTAASGLVCLELLEHERPTFILLDIQMPIMSGWEVLKAIRTSPVYFDIPVIAVTAHAMVGDKQRALDAGFDGYITKPISPLTFIEEIETILMNRQTRVDNR